ncbi:MAG: ribonuclease D [Alphaproteobacteria bacterium]
MVTITDTETLAAVCARMRAAPFVTVDTEFLREKTYWAILCLVQLASPDEAVIVDPLAAGIDLAPMHELMADPNVLKVFHAARQDIEIFVTRMGTVPAPIFDTQVAAMVCGFGDQVAYDTLVRRLAGANIDKLSRFTDWTHRPLSERQLSYALADVTHLRTVYRKLSEDLERTGRADWLEEEMAILTDPRTYRVEPEDAWRRIKRRGGNPRFHAVLKALAAWREREAQARDIPRNRVIRDETLLDIAAHPPDSVKALARARGLSKGFAEGKMGKGLLDAVQHGLDNPIDPRDPDLEAPPVLPKGIGPLTDLLKVLLKRNCETHNVAARLVAGSEDLERIAADDGADVPALKGWRREIFGEQALALKHGRLAMAVDGDGVRIIELPADAEPSRAGRPASRAKR